MVGERDLLPVEGTCLQRRARLALDERDPEPAIGKRSGVSVANGSDTVM
jgi:hypothetical protein